MKKTVILTVLMVLLALGIASAIPIIKISDGGAASTLSGSMAINVSDVVSIHNGTIVCTSTSTGGTLTINVNNATAADGNSSELSNSSFDSRQVVDSNDYSCIATVYNLSTTGTGTTSSATVFTVDNTVPTCTFNTAFTSGGEYKPTQTWTVAGLNATSGTLAFGSNAPYGMSEVTSDSFTYSGQVTEGIYDVVAKTSDGTNSTTCSLTDVKIDSDTSQIKAIAASAGAAGAKLTTATSGNSNMIVVVLLGLGVLYWWKKRK